MEKYVSRSGKSSGVTGFELHDTYILVRFSDYRVYKYSYSSAGAELVERMKQLAISQNGLSTFISQNNPPYESRK